MKVAEREEARRLRKQEGLSVKEIERKLGVSRGSVSRWVRDIALTEQQKRRLDERGSYSRAQRLGSEANRRLALEKRRYYQEQGRRKAQEKDHLHIAGCMLYWAEGKKDRTRFEFSNSDINMIKFFIRFLKESLIIKEKDITIRINCYTDCYSVKEIEDFWLQRLDLPKLCLRKTQVLCHLDGFESKRKRKLPYGVCFVCVNSVEATQHAFGAIQEYSGADNGTWIA